MKTYTKQTLENYGYATHALTDRNGHIYGINKHHWISLIGWKWLIEQGETFYWSDVFRSGPLTVILRTGMGLFNATPEQLNDYFEQSKVNCND